MSREEAPLKAGAERGKRKKLYEITAGAQRRQCFCSRITSTSRHENFHKDKINLLCLILVAYKLVSSSLLSHGQLGHITTPD